MAELRLELIGSRHSAGPRANLREPQAPQDHDAAANEEQWAVTISEIIAKMTMSLK